MNNSAMREGKRTVEHLADAIIENLAKSYDLVYVDYRDELSAEDAAALVRGDTDAVFESMWEWEADNRWDACEAIIGELADDVVTNWEHEDDADYSELLAELPGDEYDRVRFTIEERDSSDWVRDLIRNTPNVLLRINVIDEDHGYSFEEVAVERVLEDVKLPVTPENVATMNSTLAECSPEYSVLMGYWIVGADLSDIYDLPVEPDAEVEIVNPYLYLGNPFVGSGFISERPFEGTVRVKRSDLKTDKDAFGYAVDEVYGGLSPSSFECVIRLAESPPAAA
jgi:hypothetical protein